MFCVKGMQIMDRMSINLKVWLIKIIAGRVDTILEQV